jgi:hypothetical protein
VTVKKSLRATWPVSRFIVRETPFIRKALDEKTFVKPEQASDKEFLGGAGPSERGLVIGSRGLRGPDGQRVWRSDKDLDALETWPTDNEISKLMTQTWR